MQWVVVQFDLLTRALLLLLLLLLPLSPACLRSPSVQTVCVLTLVAGLALQQNAALTLPLPLLLPLPLQVSAEHSLQLQPLERVVTVEWQNTQQGPPLEPYQAAAAILTTQVTAAALSLLPV